MTDPGPAAPTGTDQLRRCLIQPSREDSPVNDLIFLALTGAFLLGLVALVRAADRL